MVLTPVTGRRGRVGIGRLLQDGHRRRYHLEAALGFAHAQLRAKSVAAQQAVDHLRHVVMHGQAVALLNFNKDVERRRRLALQNGLAGAAAARFLVGEGDGLDAADEVGEGGIAGEVFERVAVRRGDKLHAALGNRARRQRLRFGADFVDDDDLRHVVFHRFDHHRVLRARHRHLHAPRLPDAGVRNIAVTGDFVGRIDDDDALVHLVRQHPRGLAEQGGLADPGPSQQQQRLAAFDDVAQDGDRAEQGAPDPAGQPDDGPGAVADGRDAVQGALDAGAVVLPERPHVRRHVVQVLAHHLGLRQRRFAVRETRLGQAAQIKHDLQQVFALRVAFQGYPKARGHHAQQQIQVVGNTDAGIHQRG